MRATALVMRRIPFFPFVLLVVSAHGQSGWTLEQCVQRAEERNLSLRGAILNADLADKARDQSLWNYLPDLNGAATHGYNYGRVIDRFTNTFATDQVRTNNFYLSSDLMLFNGLRKHNERRQAGLSADAAMQGTEAARNIVRTQVVQQFLEVLSIEERVRATEAQLASTRQQVDRMQALVDAGRSARAEVMTLISQQAQQDYTLVDLRNQRERALLRLAQSLQLAPEEVPTFALSAPALGALGVVEPASDVESVLTNVLAQDPAYKQSELVALSAERGVAIARSGSVPSLMFNASAGTGYSGRNLETVGEPVELDPTLIGYILNGDIVYTPSFDYDTQVRPFGKQLDDNLNESLGFTLNVPIFNNMRNRLAVDQARVQHEQAKLDVAEMKDTRRRDVQDAILTQRGAFNQYQAAQRAVDAAEENLRYAEARFEQGAANSLELNTAKNDLQRVMADRITAKYTYVMAAKLLDILQGLPLTL